MIKIENKQDCCGCWACVQRCPKSCISMNNDSEGFLYPLVNEDICIDCGLCEKVCPVIHQDEQRSPKAVYASKNPDLDIRLKSSSGGIFTMLAEMVISEGGVVFGAAFDQNWKVVHKYGQRKEDIAQFRGSKYVQSRIGDSYIQVEMFLKNGREVLFTGTSCQIAGLKRYLKKEYENLLAVDVVCHGVPSPKVWKEYLDFISKGNQKFTNDRISNISFRDKCTGWKQYSFTVSTPTINGEKLFISEIFKRNIFMQGFLRNFYLRPSCYSCPARSGKSNSDLALADYWGIGNKYRNIDDDKGVGLVLIYSSKGEKTYETIGAETYPTNYEDALSGNHCLEHSVTMPETRNLFWQMYQAEGITAIIKICKKTHASLISKLLQKIILILKNKIKG